MTTGSSFQGMGHDQPVADLDALDELTQANHLGFAHEAVEIGAWAGQSTLILAKRFGSVFCVDTWEASPWEDGGKRAKAYPPRKAFQTFCSNVKPVLLDTVYPCVGRSLSWAAIWPRPIDFLFIDADHRYEAVKADILAWWTHVRWDGLIVFHDYGVFEGVTKAVDELFPGQIQRAGFSLAYAKKLRHSVPETRAAEIPAFTADDFWPQEKPR